MAEYFPRESQDREAAWQAVKKTARALLSTPGGEAPREEPSANEWCAKCKRPWRPTIVGCCKNCGHGWSQNWPEPAGEVAPTKGADYAHSIAETSPGASNHYNENAAPAPTPTTPPRDALATLEYLRARLEEAGRYEWVRRADLAIAALRAERTEHEARLAEAEKRARWAEAEVARWHNCTPKEWAAHRTALSAAQEKIEKALAQLERPLSPSAAADMSIAAYVAPAVQALRGEGRPQE